MFSSQLLDLDNAISEWASEATSYEEYQKRVPQIQKQHDIFFENRFYFVGNYSFCKVIPLIARLAKRSPSQ
jgi:hypothetical protein